jgi:translation initiation factor IF-3
MLGITPWPEATRLAIEKQLDLVEVDPKAEPPIVKLLDYGKLSYQERKEAQKKAKTRSTGSELKAVRIGVGTGKHDLEIRMRQLEKFFDEGARVEVQMVLHGREKAHPDFARQRLVEFLGTIPRPFQEEQPIRRTGRGFSVILRPVKQS